MKWLISKDNTRTLTKFAWLPTEVRDRFTNHRYIVWLDKYHQRQLWVEFGPYLGEWKTIDQWI